jgi:CheY-like chemotaxis protein
MGDNNNQMTPRARVLLVEDEWLVSEIITESLQDRGFAVFPVATARDALNYLTDGQPADILFTDIQLAGEMDGAALALAARDLRPDLAVVYTSGVVKSIQSSVPGSRFIPKPYDPGQVSNLFRQMVAAAA